MTTSKNNIPIEIIRLADRFQPMRTDTTTKATPFEPSEFLNPSTSDFRWTSRWETRITELCEVIASHPGYLLPGEAPGALDGQPRTANSVYCHYASRHAYEGTLTLALLESVRSILSWAQFIAYRNRLQFHVRDGRAFLELARHFGRPSVPAHVLPVFAIYEAEKIAGKRLDKLTDAQLQSLGLL